jgi:hypothetical protein
VKTNDCSSRFYEDNAELGSSQVHLAMVGIENLGLVLVKEGLSFMFQNNLCSCTMCNCYLQQLVWFLKSMKSMQLTGLF